MITVSNGWKAVQNQTLLPETFIEITYNVTEPGVQQDAVTTGNYPESYSNASQLVRTTEKDTVAYASLDYGIWGLDGAFSYSDGSPENPGYIDTNYSNDSCSFDVSPYPTITIDFSKRHDGLIPGITITWSKSFKCWATSFRVTAYDSSGVIASKTVTGNESVVTHVWIDLVNYSKITVEILEWSHPHHRVRCNDIRLGIESVYVKSDLMSFEHSQSVDMLSAVLPDSSVKFALRNDDGRWNPNNPTGSEKYLLEQQEVRVRYGMDINGVTEWIKCGTFWLNEWETPSNGLEADFTAKDAFSLMNVAYTGIRSGTLYDIAVAAFAEAELPIMDDGSERYIVDESLKQYETDFSEDTSEYIISEVIQMVAHAAGCVLYQDRDGMVHIEPRAKDYSHYMIEPQISYAYPEYTINKPLKAISVEYGEEFKADVAVHPRGEVQTISTPFINTREDALRIAEVAREVLENREVITGDFRADLRMDALDNIVVVSKYASNTICVTDVKYSTTGGAFKGTYTGRVTSVIMDEEQLYSGDLYVGEVSLWN